MKHEIIKDLNSNVILVDGIGEYAPLEELEAAQDKIAQLQNDILAKRVAELTGERDALAAQVENILKGDLTPEQFHRLSNSGFAVEVKAQVVRSFVSDTNDAGQLSWSDSQWLEDWRDEWLSQSAKADDNCQHNWVSAKNEFIANGSVCTKCFAIDAREPIELRQSAKAGN